MKLKSDLYLKLVFIVLIVTFISIAVMATQSSVTFTVGNYEPIMPVTEPPPMFYYQNDIFEHLETANFRIVYEFVNENRHIVAFGNSEESFVAPLFRDKDEAVIYMERYFDFLRSR